MLTQVWPRREPGAVTTPCVSTRSVCPWPVSRLVPCHVSTIVMATASVTVWDTVTVTRAGPHPTARLRGPVAASTRVQPRTQTRPRVWPLPSMFCFSLFCLSYSSPPASPTTSKATSISGSRRNPNQTPAGLSKLKDV